MNSILIYDLTGHSNSPLNTYWMELLQLYSSNCMPIASETKGYGWQSIKKLHQEVSRSEETEPRIQTEDPTGRSSSSLICQRLFQEVSLMSGQETGWVSLRRFVVYGPARRIVHSAPLQIALLKHTSHCLPVLTWLFISQQGGTQ